MGRCSERSLPGTKISKGMSQGETNIKSIEESLNRFTGWLSGYGDLSHDRMDFLGSRFGMFTKRLFYKNRVIGAPFALFALIQEAFLPSLMKIYARPSREAIADAHYAMGFMNLYEITGNREYLTRAESYLNALLESSIPGYSGHCWGYRFHWVSSDRQWPAGTPFITVTPYPFRAFAQHFRITGKSSSREVALSAASFAMKDVRHLVTPEGIGCTSYSVNDNRYIVNANTYRAATLLEAWEMTKDPLLKDEAEMNLKFVLHYQNPDGSWFYEAIGERDRFIDNFHTALVLRDLAKCYRITNNSAIRDAAVRGYAYYRERLFRKDNTPLHLSEIKNNKFRKYEMYDYAEGISLGTGLEEFIPGALDFSSLLANDLITRFQLNDGHFVTRVNSLGFSNRIPYHRWPQSQLFHALTKLLGKVKQTSMHGENK